MEEGFMGGVKRMMEHHDKLRGIATGIALEAGVLKQCQHHECLFEGDKDIDHAYKLANYKITNGTLAGVRTDERRALSDCIKEVVEDNCDNDECPECADLRES